MDFKNKQKLNIILNENNYIEFENKQLQIRIKDGYFFKDNLQLNIYLEDGQVYRIEKIISWIDFIKVSKPTGFYIDDMNRVLSECSCNDSDFLKLFDIKD